MPLYFAPPIIWFAEAIQFKEVILVNDFKFPKQTLRNRLNYGSFQGLKSFTIPLNGDTKSNKFSEVLIDYKTDWSKQFIKTFQTTYGNSPFYEYYGYKFESIINSNIEYLWELCLAFLNLIFKCLKIELLITTQEFSTKELVSTEKALTLYQNTPYYQVFNTSQPFIPNLSILDLIFNEGPDAIQLIKNI